eukprot:m.107074 g.107074  ORF g.107074 m.107074 type:complete len:74 (+) comp27768_c0_seq3:558-779(+)
MGSVWRTQTNTVVEEVAIPLAEEEAAGVSLVAEASPEVASGLAVVVAVVVVVVVTVMAAAVWGGSDGGGGVGE